MKKTIDDGSNLAFAEVLNKQNKEMRIEVTLIPLLKTGKLKLPQKGLYADNPSLKKLIEVEMSFFNPTSRTNKDDLLDALEIACSKSALYMNETNFKVGGELRTANLNIDDVRRRQKEDDEGFRTSSIDDWI